MSYIDNHVELGLNRFLEQDKERLKLHLFFTVFLLRYQLLEDILEDIINKAPLGYAQGATLDLWGTSFGVDRGGFVDDQYRQEIFANILINNSKGTVEDILNAVTLLYKPIRAHSREFDCFVQINLKSPVHLENINRVIPAIISAGIGYSVVYESANTGCLATLTSANLGISVIAEEQQAMLKTNVGVLLNARVEAVRIPANPFILGKRILLKQRLQVSGLKKGIYYVDQQHSYEVVKNLDFMLLKGSDLAIRII